MLGCQFRSPSGKSIARTPQLPYLQGDMSVPPLPPIAHEASATDARVGYLLSHWTPGLRRFSSDRDTVRLHFNLSGGYHFRSRLFGQDESIAGRRHNLFFSREFEMELEAQSPTVETFGIDLQRERFLHLAGDGQPHLSRWAEKVAAGRTLSGARTWGHEDPALFGAVHDLAHCRLQGPAAHLYRDLKTLEILELQAHSLQQSNPKAIPLRPTERERIYAARTWLSQRIAHPPGISETARAVGLNEFKLKNGFRSLFGQGLYTFVHQQRLDLAARWLLDTHTPAAEIATALGFSSPQHFSREFRNRFGQPPARFRQAPAQKIPIV